MRKNTRYGEIDSVRALALCLMLVQHIFVIKNVVFYNSTIVSQEVENIGRAGALLFLLLVGISGYISYYRHQQNSLLSSVRHFFVRGMFLIGCGVLVSILSFLVLPGSPVYFGVLSFIGASVMLLPFFIRYARLRTVTIVLAPVIGYFFTHLHLPTLLLLPFGIYPVPFHSVDYWPLFPWISVVLVGVIVGEHLYTNGTRQLEVKSISNPVFYIFQWVGSHTLWLYLLHLPVLYSIFWVLKLLSS